MVQLELSPHVPSFHGWQMDLIKIALHKRPHTQLVAVRTCERLEVPIKTEIEMYAVEVLWTLINM